MEKIRSIRVISTKALRTESILFAEQQGWYLEVYPMIETIFTYTKEHILEILDQLNKADAQALLVFSSSNAVMALFNGCKEYNLAFPEGTKACFVGGKTAETASELLQTENVLITGHAAELPENLVDLNVENFIFVSGQKRLDTIPEGFKKKGYRLKEYQVYDTLPTPVKVEGNYQGALFFSPSAVNSFFQANSWENYRVAVSVGETTAACLRSHQVGKIIVAETPDEMETMLALSSYIDEIK